MKLGPTVRHLPAGARHYCAMNLPHDNPAFSILHEPAQIRQCVHQEEATIEMSTSFLHRTVFPTLDSLPRSYYLGHHAAGLSKMRTMLSQIDLIIECRDYRVPLTSHNPMFEEALAGKERIVVYTKKDLGRDKQDLGNYKRRDDILRKWHRPSQVLFSDHRSRADGMHMLKQINLASKARRALTGSFVMVVGMPNVGKSSLLNALRRIGVGKGKVAKTGDQPGVTRKIAKSGVKITESGEDSGDVYLVDTPGVFMPYVPDTEAMLKLALCGSIKDTVIPPLILADYLLYHMNLHVPQIYGTFHEPTNEVTQLLEAVARKNGRLGKGGLLDSEASALWLIQQWRAGNFGRFLLDEVNDAALEKKKPGEQTAPVSLNQARKAVKDAARVKARERKSSTT